MFTSTRPVAACARSLRWRWPAATAAPTRLSLRLGGVLALLSLGGAQGVSGTDCRQVAAAELPRLGGVEGVWLEADRFALVDSKRNRLLVYDTETGEVGYSGPPDLPSWLPDSKGGLSHPTAIGSDREGVVLGLHTPPTPDTGGAASLIVLDNELRPRDLLRWTNKDREDASPEPSLGAHIRELAVGTGRIFAWVKPGPSYFLLELERHPEEADEFDIVNDWSTVEGEYPRLSHLPLRSLATTRGELPGVFALRFADRPFIQVLVGGRDKGEGGGMARLKAFPDKVKVFPPLPQVTGWGSADGFYAAAEAAEYAAGLYGDGTVLYLLARTVPELGKVSWRLHRIDPRTDSVLDSTELPTRAAHVSLLPGDRHWLLEESSSFADDMFRQPTRLLLLDAEAVRSGRPITCD